MIVSRVVDVDILGLPKNLGRLYFISDWAYWSGEFHFETRVRECQTLFARWKNVELFRRDVSDKATCSCLFPDRWDQYEAPSLLFVPTPFVFYIIGSWRFWGPTDDQNRIWTRALPDYVVVAGQRSLLTSWKGLFPTTKHILPGLIILVVVCSLVSSWIFSTL